MAKKSKNNKANTNKQKRIVIPKNFLEQYKITPNARSKNQFQKIKTERPDAVEQTLSASAAIKGKPYVSPNNNSKTADFIRQQNAKGDSPAREYYRNKKVYDKQFENYVAQQKKKERFAKNSKIADQITSDPNYTTKSAAPMDNTIIYFDKPLEINDGKTIIIEPTSTEIPTPKQQLASLTQKPLPETPVEKVLAYAPTAAVAAPIAYMATTGGVFPLATSIWNNPISWGTSMGLGYLGSEGVNSGVRLLSNYKYNSWGDMLGDTDTEKFILEFTNPGGWAGGIKGWNLGRGGDKAINTYRLARELNKAVKNFDGTVGESYFHAPDKWYRITSSPEIYGIKEQGMNVTTHDLIDFPNSADDFRTFVRENNLVHGTGNNEGYWIQPKNVRELVLQKKIAEETGGDTDWIVFPNDFRRYGAAHGNRTQGAWQQKWEGATTTDIDFPEYILEGNPLPDLTIPFGKNRSKFRITPIEDIEAGGRIGFKTGEMPIQGLRQFRLLPNGRYKYEGELIPDKIIKTDGTSTLIPRSDSKLNLQKTGDPFFDNADLPEGIISIPSPEQIKLNYLKKVVG